MATAAHVTLASILGGESMPRRRFQMPSVLKRDGVKRPYWYTRYRVDVIEGKGMIARQEKTKFLGYCPTTTDPIERKRRAEITKREAERLRSAFMEMVNRADYVLQSQVKVSDFVETWKDKHVSTLGAGTQQKYETHLRNHVEPQFGSLRLMDIDTEMVQAWLNDSDLGWWARNDLRNIMSCIFTKAADWDYWQDRNPVERVTVGPRRVKREKRLLSDPQTQALLAAIPEIIRLAIEIARWTGCRISEVLGLQWKHLDLVTGWAHIRQRWYRGYRGDLDVVKSERSNRDLPLGYLVDELKRLAESRGPSPDDFLFDRGDGQPYDDRELLKIVRQAARELGFYFEGLGFHSFRRSNITRIQSTGGASSIEAQLHAGHSRVSMTGEYTQIEPERHQELVRKMQEAALGKTEVVH